MLHFLDPILIGNGKSYMFAAHLQYNIPAGTNTNAGQRRQGAKILILDEGSYLVKNILLCFLASQPILGQPGSGGNQTSHDHIFLQST